MTENKIDIDDRELPDHHPYKTKRDKGHYIERKPYCIYYYHVTDITRGAWKVRHYYVSDNGDIRRQNLKDRARELGRNGKRNGHAPPKYGDDLADIVWERISYIMFLFDIPGAKLRRNNQAIEVYHKDDHGNKKDNHSFFDADEFTVDLSDNEDGSYERDVVFCTNYLQKDMNGGKLPDRGKGQYFAFNFYFEPDSIGGGSGLRQPDSGGTNQGGGVPPPDV